ncbi:MAG: FHA domain-containing protein [candidate division KSB1 bacterium]|nr:FHA domain-containing protein [candidate division KSB1 bacterium]
MSASSEILPDGTYVLNKPVKLPEILDILIVGGGPAGTAAAFRARELGLSALVIDFDDLMKEIRDFAKGKPVKPDYGGGDKMQFPKGGELIALLHFVEMDKDEMVNQWRGFYREYSIPAQVGVELIGLRRRSDGVWQVTAYNAYTKSDQTFLAKHVVLGLGCGAPRRLDLAGNIKDIAYRLSDPARYVGGPVLVLGGGTSAAEAVIAISNAKAQAGDATAVYWSYRSEKLPKVSKALADEFFAAAVDNGNIRQFPLSDPVAIVSGEDQKEYLSLRIDRRIMPGRPIETVHSEFPLGFCLACIGQEIPEKLLNDLGIPMVTGPGGKKRILITPWLESRQPNVYLIGSMLGQAYYETDDFDADPSTYRQVKHAGNIKGAMIDAVLAVEVIAQKLAGKKEINVAIKFQEEAAKPAPKPVTLMQTIIEAASAPPQERIAAAPPSTQRYSYLVRIVAGEEEDEFPIRENGITTIGRIGCDLSFPDDGFLSDRHASIAHGPEGFFLRDDGAATGVFLKVKEAKPLEVVSGNIVRLGRQFLVFRAENGGYVFIHFDQTGKPINRYPIPAKTTVVGRESPDITLDSKDMTLSRRHMSITLKENKVFIKDLGSANGTYLKVENAIRLEPDDQFRVGQQLFKLTLQEKVTQRTVQFRTVPPVVAPPKPAAPSPPKPAAAAPAVAKLEGNVVVFQNSGQSCPFKPGQTICEIAEKNGVKIKADCHIGSCGIDPVRILSGIENMNPPSDEEKGTLEDINGLAPGEYRLACVAKPKGPVVVEILEQ